MNIFITDNEKIAANMLSLINREYNGDDIVFIDDNNIIIKVSKSYYSINIDGVGFKLFALYVNRKKIVPCIHVTDYEVIEKLEEALKAYSDSKINLINCCSCNEKGQLNFEILKFITKSYKNIDYKRAWFTSLKKEDIQKAFKDLKDNSSYTGLSNAYLTDKIIDLYWEKNSKEITGMEEKINMKMIFILKLLKEREKKIDEFKQNKYFKLHIFYNDEQLRGVLYDLYGNDKLQSLREVQEVIDKIENESIFVIDSDIKTKEKEPPLLYNLSDIINEAQGIKGMNAKKCTEVLNNLYLNGYITNPNTNSRHISTETSESLMEVLAAIKKLPKYTLHIKYLARVIQTIEIGKRHINDNYIDHTEAIIPTSKIPLDKVLTSHENIIYDLIVRRFLSIFMGNEIVKKIKILGSIGEGYRVKTDDERIIQYGYVAAYMKENEIKYLLENKTDKSNLNLDINIKNVDFYKIDGFKIKEGKGREPSRYSIESLIKEMGRVGERSKGDKDKIEKRYYGVGFPEERYQILKDMSDLGYIYLETGEVDEKGDVNSAIVLLDEKGDNALDNIPKGLVDKNMLKYLNKRIEGLRKNNEDIKEVVEDNIKRLNKVLSNTPDVEDRNIKIDYESIVSKLQCPICHSKMKDRGTFIGCYDYKVCKFRIYKTRKGYVLQEKDYVNLCENGITELIKGFRFKNTNSGKAYLKVSREKRAVVFEFPSRNSEG